MLPLFVFGTLRDREVLEIVLARPVDALKLVSASLPDFRIVRLPDETYPILVPAADEARGAIIEGLGTEDMKRIEFFEGAEYALRVCEVSLTGGESAAAIYCSAGEVAPGASQPWTLACWQEMHKRAFIDRIRPYMALYGQEGGIDDAERNWAQSN